MMRYRLIVLTHGEDHSFLERTLHSVAEHVVPQPSHVLLVVDGPYIPSVYLGDTYQILPLGPRLNGFCQATRAGWIQASHSSEEWIFWLEHDFEILRRVDLRDLADVLDEEPDVAQMALMRDAVNEQEKEAGGLFESRHGQYRPRIEGRHPWLEHQAYFTTNPSLMSRDFMRANPWPDYGSECEGRLGIDLLARGYTFGAWGDGAPWVRHIGVRTGTGY